MRIFLKVPAAWARDYHAILGTLIIRAARKRIKIDKAAELASEPVRRNNVRQRD